MRLQQFAGAHDLTIIGEIQVTKDRFSRYYVGQKRVALARAEGVFTTLVCGDGRDYCVMTSDWHEVERLAGSGEPPK